MVSGGAEVSTFNHVLEIFHEQIYGQQFSVLDVVFVLDWREPLEEQR